jgi:hypothetical protein
LEVHFLIPDFEQALEALDPDRRLEVGAVFETYELVNDGGFAHPGVSEENDLAALLGQENVVGRGDREGLCRLMSKDGERNEEINILLIGKL